MEFVRVEPAYGVYPPPPPPPPVLALPAPSTALFPVPVGRPVVPADDSLVYEDYFYSDPPVLTERNTRVYRKPTTTDLTDSQLRQLTSDWQRSGSGYKSYVVGADRSLTLVDADDVVVLPSQKPSKWRVVRQQVETPPPPPAPKPASVTRIITAAPPAPVVYPAGRLPVGGYYYPPAPVQARTDVIYDPAPGYFL